MLQQLIAYCTCANIKQLPFSYRGGWLRGYTYKVECTARSENLERNARERDRQEKYLL
jgi:hypothetical protein